MKRILAIALVLSMLLAVCLMAGCGDTNVETTPGGQSGNETTPPVGGTDGPGGDSTTPPSGGDSTTPSGGSDESTPGSTEPGVVTPTDPFDGYTGETKVPGFEDVDFGNTTFVIASSTVDAEFSRMPCEDIFTEDMDAVSVAIRSRNSFVEKLYKCKIELREHESPGTLAAADVASNTHDIDLFGVSNSGSLGTSTNANALNVMNLDIDFTNPWWDQKFVQTAAAKNSNGVMTLTDLVGDFCVYGMSSTYILGFDKDVYESAGIEAKFGNIYDLVRENKWTMDLFTEIFKFAAKENSGDSTLSTDSGDILGWCTTNYAPHALHVASGLQIVTNTDGVMSFEMENHQAEWVDVIDKAIDIWKQPEHENSGYGKIRTLVPAHYTLFFSEVIDVLARDTFKDAQGLRIGLLPYPKFYESQEGYYNYVDSHITNYCVPKSVPDLQVIANFLEVFAAHSRYIVRTAWVDAYSYEYSGDLDSADMLNIILDSRTYDPGYHMFATEGEVSSWITSGKNHFSKWVGKNASIVNQKIADNVKARVKGD